MHAFDRRDEAVPAVGAGLEQDASELASVSVEQRAHRRFGMLGPDPCEGGQLVVASAAGSASFRHSLHRSRLFQAAGVLQQPAERVHGRKEAGEREIRAAPVPAREVRRLEAPPAGRAVRRRGRPSTCKRVRRRAVRRVAVRRCGAPAPAPVSHSSRLIEPSPSRSKRLLSASWSCFHSASSARGGVLAPSFPVRPTRAEAAQRIDLLVLVDAFLEVAVIASVEAATRLSRACRSARACRRTRSSIPRRAPPRRRAGRCTRRCRRRAGTAEPTAARDGAPGSRRPPRAAGLAPVLDTR